MKTLRDITVPMYRQSPFQKDEGHLAYIIMNNMSGLMFDTISPRVDAARKIIVRSRIQEAISSGDMDSLRGEFARAFKLVEEVLAVVPEKAFWAAVDFASNGRYIESWAVAQLAMASEKMRERYIASTCDAAQKMYQRSFDAEKIVRCAGLSPTQVGTLIKFIELTANKTVKTSEDDFIGALLDERSLLFSEDQTYGLASLGEISAYNRNGEVWFKVWMTNADERTCPRCGSMHGETVLVDQPFQSPVGEIMYASDVHPKCRCWTEFYRG
jgi:hypothetical protein